MRHILLVLVGITLLTRVCNAGPREDLLAAYAREDYDTAWKLAKPLAQSGDEIAEYLTGKLLRNGVGTTKDYNEALVWLRKAAEKGNSAAEDELGSVLAFELDKKDEARPWLQKAVDAKYPPAFRDLGWLVEHGSGANAFTEAAELYRRGAELNDSDSQSLYANALLNGLGVVKDEKAAAKLYCELLTDDANRQCALLIIAKTLPDVEPSQGINILMKLADRGDEESQIELSDAYLDGKVVPKNIDEGIRHLKLAMEKDYPRAYFNMGWVSSHGIGMPKDMKAALDYYKKASDKGYDFAALQVANILWLGTAGKPDQAEAIRYYKLGVENGDEDASYPLAVALSSANGALKDELAAADIFCKLETPDAMYECARLMFDEKTRKNDPDRAVALMRKASDKGDQDAQAYLGFLYMDGVKLDKDVKEGIRLTRLAADLGSSTAMHNLGSYEAHGEGVPQDGKLAMEWFKKAVDAGSDESLLSLGYLLANKFDGVYDPVGATQYFKKAADLGNEEGKLQYGYYLRDGDVIAKDVFAASDLFCSLSTFAGRYECARLNIDGTARKADKQLGYRQLAKLADEGFATAQADLGYYFFNGVGLKKNVAQGIRLTELAAAQHNATGVANIGHFYQDGLGSYHKDLHRAAARFQDAADLGSTYGMVELGKMLEGNSLGQPDLQRALTLYQQAEALGNDEAKKLGANLVRHGVMAGFTGRPPK